MNRSCQEIKKVKTHRACVFVLFFVSLSIKQKQKRKVTALRFPSSPASLANSQPNPRAFSLFFSLFPQEKHTTLPKTVSFSGTILERKRERESCVVMRKRWSQMHPYNRLPSSGHSTPSPPPSPLRSPRLRHAGRSKAGRFSPSRGSGRTAAQRLSWMFLSVLLRRQGVFLFAPLIYISGMLLYMGTASFDVVPVIKHRPAPGSVYRSPQLFAKLRLDMDSDNSSADAVRFVFKSLNIFIICLFIYISADLWFVRLFRWNLFILFFYFIWNLECSKSSFYSLRFYNVGLAFVFCVWICFVLHPDFKCNLLMEEILWFVMCFYG